jgi:hypothetical protein
VLVVDAHWMRGFASHRVTRPLVAAIAAAACTTLLFGQMSGEEGAPGGADFADASEGFAQSVGVAVLNETLTGGAAWRLALARRVAAARFDAVWFASIGMTSLDATLASFALARVQALGVGHPASTGSSAVSHFLSGAVPEVVGPLAASVQRPFGAAGDCRGRLAELEAALEGMCEEGGVSGGAGDAAAGAEGAERRMPLLAICGAARRNSSASGSMSAAAAAEALAAGGGCRLCSRFGERGPAAAVSAEGSGGSGGECRGVGDASPGAAQSSLAQALLRRLADAQRRYSERLVLAPGIGMGLTDVVTLVATPQRRRVPALGASAIPQLEAAVRTVEALGEPAAPLLELADAVRLAVPPDDLGEDGGGGRGSDSGGSGDGGEWLAGSSPERPLVVGLTWANPKWNLRHFRRVLAAARAAQQRFSLQWHRCDGLRTAGELATVDGDNSDDGTSNKSSYGGSGSAAAAAAGGGGGSVDVCSRLLRQAPRPALHVRLLAFTPMDALRAAALQAVAARVIAAELPPSARGSVTFAHVFQAGHMGQYLAALGACDLSLDAQPFAGGNTMHDLLALAVPVVSLAHDGLFEPGTATALRWRSALGASVLTVAGLSGLVALDEREFTDKFARLAASPYLRAAWRARIAAADAPHRAIQSPLEAACYAAALRELGAAARGA